MSSSNPDVPISFLSMFRFKIPVAPKKWFAKSFNPKNRSRSVDHTDQWKNRWIRQGEQQPLLLIDRYTWGEMAPLWMAEKNCLSLKWFHPLFSWSLKNTPTLFHCVFLRATFALWLRGNPSKWPQISIVWCPTKMGGISRPLDTITIPVQTGCRGGGSSCSSLAFPQKENCRIKTPFLGDQKVACFVISFSFFFWNEKRQNHFHTCLIPKHSKTISLQKKQYCPQTDMENGSVVVVEVRHIFRHLSSNTVSGSNASSACTRCISTMSRTKPWMRERESEKDVGVFWVHPGSPWAPFFMGWWLGVSLCFMVRVCHHTKGTTISKMVVDFPGVHGRSSTVYTCRLLKANRNPATGTQDNVNLVQMIVLFHHQVNHKQIYLKIMLWEDVCWISYPWNAFPPF